MSVNARRILNAIRDADHVLNDPGAGGLIDPFGDLQICELTTTGLQADGVHWTQAAQATIYDTIKATIT